MINFPSYRDHDPEVYDLSPNRLSAESRTSHISRQNLFQRDETARKYTSFCDKFYIAFKYIGTLFNLSKVFITAYET